MPKPPRDPYEGYIELARSRSSQQINSISEMDMAYEMVKYIRMKCGPADQGIADMLLIRANEYLDKVVPVPDDPEAVIYALRVEIARIKGELDKKQDWSPDD